VNILNKNAMFNIEYGLYVITTKDGDNDNGCIINTVSQVTDSPLRISVTVNKENLTHDIIKKTGLFNISVLSTDADFEIFKHFGFQSGREKEKLKNYPGILNSANGLSYLSECSNAFISGKVISMTDLGTHTLFIADVTDSEVLNEKESVTYSYYHKFIKPRPNDEKKSGYRCKICGYIYEGDPLPEDFICPLCKHGASDFEKI